MEKLNIEDVGNNCWSINGDRIYAPNENIAIQRYCAQSGNTYLIDRANERQAIKNKNIMDTV